MSKTKLKAKGIKIFILEDERDVCKYSKEFLLKRGFDAYTALTGKAAINLIKRVKPHIAILDIYLQNTTVDGLEVLKFVKENQPGCYCVMVTQEHDEEMIKKTKELGAADYLTKPLTIKELDRTINKLVSRIRKEAK